MLDAILLLDLRLNSEITSVSFFQNSTMSSRTRVKLAPRRPNLLDWKGNLSTFLRTSIAWYELQLTTGQADVRCIAEAWYALS